MTGRYLVSGRVQGVGFRWFVARRARELAVTGFVRNLPDGRVEVVAAGEPGALEMLCRVLHEGPPAARVQTVETLELALDPPPVATFEIR